MTNLSIRKVNFVSEDYDILMKVTLFYGGGMTFLIPIGLISGLKNVWVPCLREFEIIDNGYKIYWSKLNYTFDLAEFLETNFNVKDIRTKMYHIFQKSENADPIIVETTDCHNIIQIERKLKENGWDGENYYGVRACDKTTAISKFKQSNFSYKSKEEMQNLETLLKNVESQIKEYDMYE